MCICTFRASVTLVCVELFISGRSVERGKMLLQGSNIHGFARGNFVTKACLQHYVKEVLCLFIVSYWRSGLLLCQ